VGANDSGAARKLVVHEQREGSVAVVEGAETVRLSDERVLLPGLPFAFGTASPTVRINFRKTPGFVRTRYGDSELLGPVEPPAAARTAVTSMLTVRRRVVQGLASWKRPHLFTKTRQA
jgi:hypothetical protein